MNPDNPWGSEPVELEAQGFIARLVLHFPDVQERQVVYYGAYANASRLRSSHRQAAENGEGSVWVPGLEEPTPFERQQCIRWAQLIKGVWLEDPLLCPERIPAVMTPRGGRVSELGGAWIGAGSRRQDCGPCVTSGVPQ